MIKPRRQPSKLAIRVLSCFVAGHAGEAFLGDFAGEISRRSIASLALARSYRGNSALFCCHAEQPPGRNHIRHSRNGVGAIVVHVTVDGNRLA